jgi:transcriptional regulator with XRE-family HTH domain
MGKSQYTRAYKAFRQHIIAARHAAGLTQEQLAKHLGRPQSFVAKYEGGERRLDIVEFLQIAQLLELDERKICQAIKAEL